MAMVITQKVLGNGVTPPPLLGKIPKKYRFFFWQSHLSDEIIEKTVAKLLISYSVTLSQKIVRCGDTISF